MLVAGQEVTFIIETGASINMLPAKYGTEPYMHMPDESSSSDCNREWCNCISTPNKKSIKCKMLVAGQDVTFIIETGASINMLPVKYAKYGTEPYSGVLKMWNEVEDKPIGTCRMKVTNPRNGKKYSVPFVVLRVTVCSYWVIEQACRETNHSGKGKLRHGSRRGYRVLYGCLRRWIGWTPMYAAPQTEAWKWVIGDGE